MAIENYTTYTEVDTPGVFSVTADTITVTNADQDHTAYVYKDYTADYFNDIDATFEAYLNSTSNNSGAFGAAGMTVSTVDSAEGFGTSDWHVWIKEFSSKLQVWFVRGPYTDYDFYDNAARFNTVNYYNIERSASSDTMTCKFYSDAEMTTLVDTLTVTGFGTGTKYRYAYGATTYDNGNGSRDADGYVSDLDLGIVSSVTAESIKTMNTLTFTQ